MFSKEWMTKKSPKVEWWLKKRELIGHKRIEQRGKVKTTSSWLCETIERWLS
jgi:hypothetical protein